MLDELRGALKKIDPDLLSKRAAEFRGHGELSQNTPEDKVVEKTVEVPDEKFVEETVKFPSKPRVENQDVECQADSRLIRKDVFDAQHRSVHENDFLQRVQGHQKKYPGGTLPTELRSFEAFVRHRATFLARDVKSHCLVC